MSQREAIRSGRAPDPLGWALALGLVALAATLAAGCADERKLRPIVHHVGPGVAHIGTCAQGTGTCSVPVTPIDEQLIAQADPGSWRRSPRGVRVWVPSWLRRAPDLLGEAMQQIDTQLPDHYGRDGRIRASDVGVPLHVTVIIQAPGSFHTYYSPSHLARGLTDMRSEIRVSWRVSWFNERPLLPALGHELDHVYTGDPDIGH